MKSLTLKTVIVSATVFGALAATLPTALSQEPAPEVVVQDDVGPGDPQLPVVEVDTDEGMPGPGPHGPRPDLEFGALDLAAKLSAAEICLGITPDQLGPWRSYASAFVVLADMGPPGAGGPKGMPGPKGGARPPMPGARPPADGKAPEAVPLPGERLADGILAIAEKAKALKDAADALEPILTSEQHERFGRLERVMMPPKGPGPHGPAGDVRG